MAGVKNRVHVCGARTRVSQTEVLAGHPLEISALDSTRASRAFGRQWAIRSSSAVDDHLAPRMLEPRCVFA